MSQPSIPKQKKEIKRNRLIVGSVIGILFAGFVLFSEYGLWTRFRLEFKKRALEEEVQASQKQQDSLVRMIRVLKTDTLEIERIAREEYGMVKPGEKVYIVPEK
ncbi:MAG TPA: septum formation initiator family protein [Patescibacteria group bacterium]|nr:septum formation initiator family protein [Patescibacteria group bacterium]